MGGLVFFMRCSISIKWRACPLRVNQGLAGQGRQLRLSAVHPIATMAAGRRERDRSSDRDTMRLYKQKPR